MIAVVALLLFSPRELPKMLRSAARFWAQLRSTADEFRDTLMHADGMDEVKELVQGTRQQIRDVENEARREMLKARSQMRRAQQKLALTNKAKQQQRESAAKTATASAAAGSDEAPPSDEEPEEGVPVPSSSSEATHPNQGAA